METWRVDALNNHLGFLRGQLKRLREELQEPALDRPAHRRQVLREIQQLTGTIEQVEKTLRKG